MEKNRETKDSCKNTISNREKQSRLRGGRKKEREKQSRLRGGRKQSRLRGGRKHIAGGRKYFAESCKQSVFDRDEKDWKTSEWN